MPEIDDARNPSVRPRAGDAPESGASGRGSHPSARARGALRFPYGAAARRKSVPAGSGRIVGPDTWAALWEIRPRRGRAVMLMAT